MSTHIPSILVAVWIVTVYSSFCSPRKGLVDLKADQSMDRRTSTCTTDRSGQNGESRGMLDQSCSHGSDAISRPDPSSFKTHLCLDSKPS